MPRWDRWIILAPKKHWRSCRRPPQRFRFVLEPAAIRPRGILGISRDGTIKPAAFTVQQLRPIAGARINGFEAKAGFERRFNPMPWARPMHHGMRSSIDPRFST